jgi:hypothetical protein
LLYLLVIPNFKKKEKKDEYYLEYIHIPYKSQAVRRFSNFYLNYYREQHQKMDNILTESGENKN